MGNMDSKNFEECEMWKQMEILLEQKRPIIQNVHPLLNTRYNGNTPLTAAVKSTIPLSTKEGRKNKLKIVEFLCDKGADVNACDDDGNRPIDIVKSKIMSTCHNHVLFH
jgi:hypothetical protein